MSVLSKGDSINIRDVWNGNLVEEFARMREIVDDFPYIAMDTEFPGIVLRPVGNFKTSSDFNYQTLKANVDMLKLIQIGLTFSDENGNLPTCGTDKYCVWQFNFREFNVNEDVFANDSIELLRQSGIDFKKNNEEGIDAKWFSELLMSSGIVLNENVHWVTFHSGYDFGYLVKLLTCQNLPETQVGFFDLIKMFFPTLYDIKHLMKFCNSLHGGLNKLAELLGVERVGICHQAGSDSLLTSCCFMKLKESFFNGSTEKYSEWITEYFQSRPGLKILQERIDEFITTHEEQEEEARKEREAHAAEGGWTVVVHHRGRKKTTDAESGITVGSVAQAAVVDKMAKKKRKDVGVDFYRFQKREAQRNEIMMLQSKFEQDRKRIQQLRSARKFRPY